MSDSKSPNLQPAVDTRDPANPSEGRPGFLPRLPVLDWAIYGILAAALAVTNIYTTLLTGWGDGGSIIAVIAAVMVLGALGRRTHIQSLNLGQTMASAGGTVGFAACSYAAVKIAFPDYEANMFVMMALFVGMALIGTVIGATVRTSMVKYYFPSGTACAVIQRTVTNRDGGPEAKRPIQLLAIFGSIAAVWSTLATITFKKGGAALLTKIPLGTHGGVELGVALNPVFFGIGVVVGPRVGLGMVIGGLLSALAIPKGLQAWASADNIAHTGDWVIWSAIAVLTLPTFATLAYAYLFRTQPVIPPGFVPGKTTYAVPRPRNIVLTTLAILGVAVTAFTAWQLFDLPFHGTVMVVALCWPLAIMNGRVTGDTDINPVRLVVIVILTVFAMALSSTAVMLLGMAIIASMLAGMAVDMMQDYRTGYLVDANPTHQTSVQVFGVVIGALVAIPFIFLLDAKMGFGPGSSLPAPGPQIYAKMAQAFSGGAFMSQALVIAIIVISVVGCAYAFFTVWPKSQKWMPSIFGAGIGMLLPFDASAAIFAGGMVKFVAIMVARSKAATADKEEAALRTNDDTLIAGSSVFAAAALMAVVLILIAEVTGVFHIAH